MESAIGAQDDNVFELGREALDTLPFGVITLDRIGLILRFNREQETFARRRSMQTVGLNFFSDVAPCTNVHAFRGRFDAFASQFDSGAERFAFSFAFRWGRQDMSITLLRKAGHDEINILVQGKSLDRRNVNGPDETRAPALPRSADVKRPTLLATHVLSPPVVSTLAPTDATALRSRVHPDEPATVSALIAAAARDRTTYAVEYRGVSADGERRIFHEHGSFLEDPPQVARATIVDVTEQRQIEADTWHSAYYDSLTGLPNRRLLLLRIADAIAEAEANHKIAAVIFANVNHFRNVNDVFGYANGDAVLREVALRLGEGVRSGDTVARLISDWFVVLLTDVDSPQSVGDAATRLIAAVGQPFTLDDHPYHLTLRLGISLAPFDSRDSLALLRAAESAMFAAKANGRGGIQFYTGQLAIDAVSNLERQNELRAGLENGEFELLYQPLVDIDHDRVIAAEALVRWNHPTRGLVSPAEFIPLADRTGLIIPLGEWVLRTACRQAREWADSGIDVRVCVNVSTVQFQRADFVDLVAAIIADTGVIPDRLELELTESIMVDGFGEMMDTLTRLKSLGLRLAIDDFGTGYSSLAYLKYFPVDTLKVDRAFIIDITSDAFDQAIATAIFTLTDKLKLECVVEGVETEDQLEKLRDLGCTVVQGYYFCKPSPAKKLTGLLSASVAVAGLWAAQPF